MRGETGGENQRTSTEGNEGNKGEGRSALFVIFVCFCSKSGFGGGAGVKTLAAIEEVCRVLERHCSGVEESLRVLNLTRAFLSLTVEISQFDPAASAARVHEAAKERIRRIADKTAPAGAPALTREGACAPHTKK